MDCLAFSRYLKDITKPTHPYYYPVQVSLVASLAYVGTRCFTSLPPLQGTTLAVLMYSIDQFTTPLVGKLIRPYQDITLVPLVGQVLHLTLSLLLTKAICQLAGYSFSFKQMRSVGIVFLVTLAILHFALRQFRRMLHPVAVNQKAF